MHTNEHEWQKNYLATKSTKVMGKIRTTNAHECTRMAKELFNHECTRISSIHGIEALITEMVMLRSWFCRGLRFATLWRSRHPRPTYCYWARNSGTNFAASSPPATPCPKESQYGGSAAVSERLSKMTNPIRSAVASCGVVPRAFHGMAIS